MKICWFTAGEDKEDLTLFQEVLSASEEKRIDGEISLVFMNKEKGESSHTDEFIADIEARGIPLETVSSRKFLKEQGLGPHEGKTAFDALIKTRIEKYDFDVIFLAGYTLILSRPLFEAYPVFRLHPALPGTYKGKREDVITSTIKDGVRTFGAMIHMVDDVLDEGVPVAYVKLELEGRAFDEFFNNIFRGDSTSFDHLLGFMRQAECTIETPLIIETLSALSKGNLRITDRKVYYGDELVHGGVDITNDVFRAVCAKLPPESGGPG